GLSDSPGTGPVASTTVASTSAGATLPAGEGGCTFSGQRYLHLDGGQFRYAILSDGASVAAFTPSTDSPAFAMFGFFTALPITNLGGHNVQVQFQYTAGPAPTAASGVWLDNLSLSCITALSATTGYGELDGTSMAAPHVSGAAALLFSFRPSATVSEV